MGYLIIHRNYRGKEGEIDLVAEKDDTLVFVEVRSRTGTAIGSPEESVGLRKRLRLVAAAQEYLQVHGAEGREWRIDVVAVQFGPGGRVARLDVHENAVEL